MTEQPKLIESVEEALEAEKQGRLQWNTERCPYPEFQEGIAKTEVRLVANWIENEWLCWKPEEYEYVTMESFRLGEFSEYQYQDQDDGEWISLTAESVSWMIGPIINSMKKKENRLRRKKVEGGGEIELVEEFAEVSERAIRAYKTSGFSDNELDDAMQDVQSTLYKFEAKQ